MTVTKIDVVRETAVSTSARARQLEGMFDVPREEKSRVEWHGEIDFDEHDWQIGAIVGPSGSGKSTLLREIFGTHKQLRWKGASVIDDFDAKLGMQDVAEVCQAVGFNTVPAWLRPYDVLSGGEQFRVDLARRLVESPELIVVDEFTSVVDRQVAKIGAHAVQKYVRRNGRRFVAASCHYDVIDWLQPDWVLEPTSMQITWRSVQPRPRLDAAISPVPYSAWRLFAPFHYLTHELNRTARCFVLFVEGQPASFAAILRRPHATARNIMGFSRSVTLPDWQGLGLQFILTEYIAAMYRAIGERVRTYPAHPAFVRGYDRSPLWKLEKKPGTFGPRVGATSGMRRADGTVSWRAGSRPCAVFEYIGPAIAEDEARRVLSYWKRDAQHV